MRYIISLAIAALLLSSCARQASFSEFHREHKESSQLKLGAPAWLAKLFIPKKDIGADQRQLLRKAKFFKVMVFDDRQSTISDEFKSFANERGMVSLFEYSNKEEDARIYLAIDEKDIIREVVIVANDGEDLVLMGAKVRLSKDELSRAIHTVAAD